MGSRLHPFCSGPGTSRRQQSSPSLEIAADFQNGGKPGMIRIPSPGTPSDPVTIIDPQSKSSSSSAVRSRCRGLKRCPISRERPAPLSSHPRSPPLARPWAARSSVREWEHGTSTRSTPGVVRTSKRSTGWEGASGRACRRGRVPPRRARDLSRRLPDRHGRHGEGTRREACRK